MQQFLTDYGTQIIYAALVLAFMFAGMRYFYGCWPWELQKTWYATKYDRERVIVMEKLLERSTGVEPPVKINPEQIAEKLKSAPPSNDSFEREPEPKT